VIYCLNQCVIKRKYLFMIIRRPAFLQLEIYISLTHNTVILILTHAGSKFLLK